MTDRRDDKGSLPQHLVTSPFAADSGLVFACAYTLRRADTDRVVDEMAFFRRTDDTDELWITEPTGVTTAVATSDLTGSFAATRLETHCAVSLPQHGEIETSCPELLGYPFRARRDLLMPLQLTLSGLVSRRGFEHVLYRLERDSSN